MPNFYPRPPRGGRPSGPSETSPLEVFLSTPSARRATFWGGFSFWLPVNFYPRPPRGGRPPAHPDGLHIIVFLSTPSARRATAAEIFWQELAKISIHALREEGDTSTLKMDLCSGISIHALREEGDLVLCAIGVSSENISIHALREEGDDFKALAQMIVEISIHALREEGDQLCAVHLTTPLYFYPRPPRGGRLLPADGLPPMMIFLSTPSARRATFAL